MSELIENSGLSLRKLQEESEVRAMQYSRYLRGFIPTIDITLKIAKFFDCSLDYLFGLDHNKNNNFKSYDYDLSGFLDKYEALLDKNNISHYKFAQKNFFDESIKRHWKAGRKPRLDVLYIIAKELGGSIDYLVGRK